MFSNFEKAFLNKDEVKELIPQEIIRVLTQNLPDGFEYKAIGNGACTIVPMSHEFKIGLNIEIPKDVIDKAEISTMGELMEYAYRTQCPLKVVTKDKGHISLNGKVFKIDEFIKFPFNDNVIDGNELYIRPEPFPPPFKLKLEGEDTTRYITIQRQPYSDMHKSYFKDVDDGVFEITYIFDEVNEEVNFTFNVRVEKSKKVKEILEGLKLYQSFLKGNGKIEGGRITKFKGEDIALEKTIESWDRIYQLEKKLGVEFILEFPITIEDNIWIEKLCRAFLDEKPYKQYINIDTLTIKGVEEGTTDRISKDGDLAFEFIQSSELLIWGVKLDTFDVVGIFDLKVTKVTLVNKESSEYELSLNPTTEKGIYQSIRHFLTIEEAENFRNNLEVLKNAELINIH